MTTAPIPTISRVRMPTASSASALPDRRVSRHGGVGFPPATVASTQLEKRSVTACRPGDDRRLHRARRSARRGLPNACGGEPTPLLRVQVEFAPHVGAAAEVDAPTVGQLVDHPETPA